MTVNVVALIFLLVSATSLLTLPRKWAPIPLLASCCYMTIGQGIDLGPISLPVYRIILAVGLLRVILRREMPGRINPIDKLMAAWAIWILFASLFHEWKPGSGPIYASGFVYNISLVYFLTRAWCRDLTELESVLKMVAWLLVPVAVAMVTEHLAKRNYFGVFFGGIEEKVYMRDGKIRAQGPFVHPLLAGTVGAVCFPLFIGIWRKYRVSAVIGIAACLVIVPASKSSGPLMSLFFGICALFMWRFRTWVRTLQWSVIGTYVLADILMTRPAYYLISKIDLTGSSTGWYRSHLIEMAISHISEWWAFGTDYTVQWTGIAVDAAGKMSDITNYYLWMGVVGGLPAMLLLIAILWRAFSWVGKIAKSTSPESDDHRFMIWCLGAGLLAHAVTSLSMGYPDQSMMFFWLNVGAISSLYPLVSTAVQDRGAPKGIPPGRWKHVSPEHGKLRAKKDDSMGARPGQWGRI
jgi:hypothetical protein